MQVLKDFFKSKKLGFYFTAAVVVLSIVQLIIYVAAFTPVSWESYMHWSVIFFFALAIVSGIVLSLFKVTSPYAPVVATLMVFLSFLMFIRYGYMYFSQVYYTNGDVKLTISQMITLTFQMYYGYLVSIIFYIISLGLGIASIFLKQVKTPEQTNGSEQENETEATAITEGGEA